MKHTTIWKTLELFNGVLFHTPKPTQNQNHVEYLDGYIITPGAIWAREIILDFYREQKLNGKQLNQTFHKSWNVIKYSSRQELLQQQIIHYLSTYGTNFQDEVYIPNEILKVPDLKISYKVVHAYTKKQLQEKCLEMLQSGIALKSETIDDILHLLLDELQYEFTGKENIRNKEAICKLVELYSILPDDPVEFLRYVIFRSTGETLLIKSPDLINKVKNSVFNPIILFNKYDLKKLSQIYNRFKPLFLAYKNKCPRTINKLSKYSKKYHKPLVINPINLVTQHPLKEEDVPWLENATIFSLFKALQACYTRIHKQDHFTYRIRNGKSFTKKNKKANQKVCTYNFNFIIRFLVTKYNQTGHKFYFPKNIRYALPTSEKMFVGNIPTGTKFIGKKLVVGIYWRNDWGAYDLDLSAINLAGKVGWNADYNQQGTLLYSGDMTSAPNGAVEYLHADKGLSYPSLIQNNVYHGNNDCEYKIVIGKGSNISHAYMINPNNLMAEVKCQSKQKQTVLGFMLPADNKQEFVLLNFGAGAARISTNSPTSEMALKALFQQYEKSFNMETLISYLGGEIVEDKEKADFDFSIDNLQKDSFLKPFNGKI